MYPMQAYPQLIPVEPVFTVRVTKHTGALFMWVDQTTTVTGTYQRCEAAIRDAQMHCLLAGWWSFLSILLMNWIALYCNWAARRVLRSQAARARAMAAHPSAQSRQPYPAAPYPGAWPAHPHQQMPAAQYAGYRA
jgi:hypothetical protein